MTNSKHAKLKELQEDLEIFASMLDASVRVVVKPPKHKTNKAQYLPEENVVIIEDFVDERDAAKLVFHEVVEKIISSFEAGYITALNSLVHILNLKTDQEEKLAINAFLQKNAEHIYAEKEKAISQLVLLFWNLAFSEEAR
jgi:hypothetical protein